MTGIRNTTEDMKDPAEQMLALAVGMSDGGIGSFITGQERAGQQQLVHSDRLPSDVRDRAAFEALGFTFGDPDPGDPMFMPATLPAGWTRAGSDHAMWSYLLDSAGRQRVAIFYKAAFYDRSAFMRLTGLDSYVATHVEYDGPMVLTDEWATRETVMASLAEHAEQNRAEAAVWREAAADVNGRAADNRERCAEYAAEHEATAAKYAALLAEYEAQTQGGGQ